MRVACIGNMNNNFFTLVRYLRDRSIEADLLLFSNELPHFHPANDTFDCTYEKYTKYLSWGHNFWTFSEETVKEDLRPFDILVGTGVSPAFVNKIGRNLDVYVPHGSDLYMLPFREFSVRDPAVLVRTIRNFRLAPYQTRGIRDALTINVDRSYPYLREPLEKLGYPIERMFNVPFPMVYEPDYRPGNQKRNIASSYLGIFFQEIRERNDIVVFHHGRQIWGDASTALGSKGNDKLIRGFGRFVRQNAGVKAHMILAKYGPAVARSRRLIESLGIQQCVSWMPLTSRKHAMLGLQFADLGTGDFDTGGYMGGVIQEVLASGKPLMHFRRDDIAHNIGHIDPYPLINVASENDITEALQSLIERPQFFQKMGEEARNWFLTHVVSKSIDRFVEVVSGR